MDLEEAPGITGEDLTGRSGASQDGDKGKSPEGKRERQERIVIQLLRTKLGLRAQSFHLLARKT